MQIKYVSNGKARQRSGSRPVHNVDDELAAYDLWVLQATRPEPMRVEVAVNACELDTGVSVSAISKRKYPIPSDAGAVHKRAPP